MSLRRFCDGCEKKIRHGQPYVNATILTIMGEPVQGGDFHNTCWETETEYKQLGASKDRYELRIRQERASY